MKYLLDANVFIQAKNFYYDFDTCPGFWDWLVAAHTRGDVHSVAKVGEELEAGGDELAKWASKRGNSFFLDPTRLVIEKLKEVSDWVTAQSYEPAAVDIFFQSADYYLIGHALALSLPVVTHELVSTSTKKIKIPNVCVGLRLKYINTFGMLRREGAKFVLDAGSRSKRASAH